MVTPPLNGLILPGVVRSSLLSIAREWNQFEVSERSITMKEVIQLLSENRVSEEKRLKFIRVTYLSLRKVLLSLISINFSLIAVAGTVRSGYRVRS